jgi:hypothetical protein
MKAITFPLRGTYREKLLWSFVQRVVRYGGSDPLSNTRLNTVGRLHLR